MKKIAVILLALLAAMTLMLMTSCDQSELDNPGNTVQNQPSNDSDLPDDGSSSDFDVASARAAAKQELTEYLSASDYGGEYRAAFASALEAGKAVIDNGNTQAEIDRALADAKAGIDEILLSANMYVNVCGGFWKQNNGKQKSTTANALAVKKYASFDSGTLSTTVTLTGESGDSGIVFAVTNPQNKDNFWESGVSYYFFFLSWDGKAYLGKVDNGSWVVCSATDIPGFNPSGAYEIAVSRDTSNEKYDLIHCYVDDTLYVSYKDSLKLSGTEYGLRAGVKGVTYTDIIYSEDVMGKDTIIDGFDTVNGSWTTADNAIVSSTGNALAVSRDEFVYGTLEATVILSGTASDNGLVFALSSDKAAYWEGEGISYYFFFLSLSGHAYLGKTDNGSWDVCQLIEIPNFRNDGTYALKVEREEDVIRCYANGVKYIDFSDGTALTGKGYGIRAGSAGVSFRGISCDSHGEIAITYPDDLTVLSGEFTGKNGSVKTASSAHALIDGMTMTEGTLSAEIAGGNAGLIFNYKKTDSGESYYRFNVSKNNWEVQLYKVINGVETKVASNYVTAGFNTGINFRYKVVVTGGKAYCTFFNTLYFVEELDNAVDGDGVGLISVNGAARFSGYSVSATAEVETVDTLLFGHSYFELWANYKDDLKDVDGLGTYTNIGIGGSIAAHWNNFEKSIEAFNPKLAIYMIGINDLTGGASPTLVANNVKSLLLNLKATLPELRVVLLGVNRCPAREYLTAQISETNELYRQLAASYDWISYAELETAFSGEDGTPLDSWFTDGLHPTASGYVQKIVPAIKTALNGFDTSSADTDTDEALLAAAKEIKKLAISDYSENAFRAEEWATASTTYAEALAAIDACSRVSEVNELDLSGYIATLAAIKNKAMYISEEIAQGNVGFEDPTFTATIGTSGNGVYNIAEYGWRLQENADYSELNFTFRLDSFTNDVGIAGILFNASKTENNGVNGYLLNYVTANNYLQIWYLNNSYPQNGGTVVCEYIGGWVFPGTVADTLFRAIVRDGFIYLYEDSAYRSAGDKAYGCAVELKCQDYERFYHGSVGFVSWQTDLTSCFEIKYFSAVDYKASELSE